MFDFLKGGKARLTLTLDRATPNYRVGETVHATVNVVGEKDLKIQQGRLVLVYKEEYKYRHQEWETDSDGHRTRETVETWATDEREVCRQLFFDETTITAGSNKTFEFDLPIPADAPPKSNGQITRISWIVKAILDRKMASDTEQKIELNVTNVLSAQPVQESTYGMSNEPTEATLALTLPSLEFVLGESIQGKFHVHPNKSFDVSEMRIVLRRMERVPRDEGNKAEQEFKVKIGERTKLQAGAEQVYPFTLSIPPDAPVSFHTPNSSQMWTIAGVLARSLRKDTQVEQEIKVYSTRANG